MAFLREITAKRVKLKVMLSSIKFSCDAEKPKM